MSEHRLCLELLGGLSVRWGEILRPLPSGKPAELLVCLALAPGRPQERAALRQLLWPRADDTAGNHNFRSTLHRLSDLLKLEGAPPVLRTDHGVGLDWAYVLTDVAEFEAALTQAETAQDLPRRLGGLTRAVRLYCGPLVPRFDNAAINLQRHRLEAAYRLALLALIAALEEAHDHAGALECARRAVAHDPLWEEAQETLLRLLAAQGRLAEARRQYRRFEQTFLTELGFPPSLTARSLLESVPSCTLSSPPRAQTDGQNEARADSVALAPHLPVYSTRFFGREEEQALLLARLQPSDASSSCARLITLTGLAGVGKTRLAVRTARQAADAFGGAVWFTAAADLSDPKLLPDALLKILGLTPTVNRDPLEQVAACLNRQPSLLLIDNLEHLLDGGKEIVEALRKRCPALTLLVTSRRPLRLPGEETLTIPPLPVPRRNAPVPAAASCAGLALFQDRAQQAHPSFSLARNLETAAALCRRLDGIPLAIELAAARTKSWTPGQILKQVNESLRVLKSREPDTPARQRTLRAAVAWSLDLLPEALQRFLGKLSVFRGGCDLEAVREVCAEEETLPRLQALAEHSLLVCEPQEEGQAPRYRLLETLRECAAERLEPSVQRELAQRHAVYFLRLAEAAEPATAGPEAERWLERLETERDNLRAALARAAEYDAACGLRMVKALGRFWHIRGHGIEGRQWTERLLAAGQEIDLPLKADALLLLGGFLWYQSEIGPARAKIEEAVNLYRRLGNRQGEAAAVCRLGEITRSLGEREQACVFFKRSLKIAREIDDKRSIAAALLHLGRQDAMRRRFARAQAMLAQGLALYREMKDKRAVAAALDTLGYLTFRQGECAEAQALYEESLALRRELQDRRGIALSYTSLAQIKVAQGEYVGARSLLEESLTLCRELQDKQGMSLALRFLSQTAVSQGEYTEARSLLKERLAISRQLGSRKDAGGCLVALAGVAARQGDRAFALACYQEGLQISRELGDSAKAARILGALAALSPPRKP